MGGGGGGGGVPPHQRHPQVPLFGRTGTPKYDLFSKSLLLIITFQEMTIKHLIYTWQVPFLYTERPVWFVLVLKFAMEDFVCRKKCCKCFGPEGIGVFSGNFAQRRVRVTSSFLAIISTRNFSPQLVPGNSSGIS